ncbi:MAG: hypothetical protein KTR25_04800 [Myxococcales bacterium]|nr:hypothetical protein [Myxococcales bacterium]
MHVLKTFLWTITLTILVAGCGDDEPDPADTGGSSDDDGGSSDEGPLWVVTGWTSSGDEYRGFLATTSDITTGEIKVEDVIDLGTDMSFGSDEGGNVFVGRGDSPIIQRWSLDEQRELQMAAEMNLGGLGITSTFGGNRNVIQIISETRAYYFDNQGFQVVVFNPTDMTITDNFDLEEISEDAAFSSLNFITRVDDRFFVSTRRWDEADNPVKELRVAIVDANSESVTYTSDTRCGDMAFSVADDEANVYFGSHHALGLFGSEDTDPAAPKPCMLRILAGETEFDPNYQINLNELVDGIGAGLFQGPNGTAFIAKYEGPDTDIADQLNSPVWRLHQIELGDEVASLNPVADLPLVARFVATFETAIDGATVPFLVLDSDEESLYMSIADPEAPASGLSMSGGFLGRAEKLTD